MKDDTVSSTAFSVAQGVMYISGKNKLASLVSDPEKNFYEKILQSSSAGLKKWKQLNNPLFLFMVPFAEKLMVPGLTIHYVLRKKAIENFTRLSIENGAKQVVNLGAGFDSLAYRLAVEDPKLTLIEVDHPATHKIKKEAFKAMGQMPKNLHMLSVDFNKDSVGEKLEGFSAFNPKLPTVFVIEGVLMYLDEPKIVDLFNSLKKICKKGFRLVFTFIMPDGEASHSHGPLLHIYLKFKSEPLNWKVNKSGLKKFMNENEIPILSVVKSEDVLKETMPGLDKTVVHDGELIACAEYRF